MSKPVTIMTDIPEIQTVLDYQKALDNREEGHISYDPETMEIFYKDQPTGDYVISISNRKDVH